MSWVSVDAMPEGTAFASSVVARFNNLVPYRSQLSGQGIPRPVMEFLAAGKVCPVLSPAGLVGRNAQAAVRGEPGLCVTLLETVPGDGPQAHIHTQTLETFFCLEGTFEVSWGSELEHKLVLNPDDLCSVPAGVFRAFKNIGQDLARLKVFIQGDANMSDKLSMHKSVGANIGREYGQDVLDKLADINMRFDAVDDVKVSPEKMKERVLRSADWVSIPVKGDPNVRVATLLEPSGKVPGAIQGWKGADIRAIQFTDRAQFDLPAEARVARLIFARTSACSLTIDGSETVELGHYDSVFVPAERNVSILNKSAGVATVFVSSQYPLQ